VACFGRISELEALEVLCDQLLLAALAWKLLWFIVYTFHLSEISICLKDIALVVLYDQLL
jgi:hypothetical protein